MLNKQLRTKFLDAFAKTKYTLRFGQGWVNIMRPDGLNCEFYTCAETRDSCYLTGTYTVKGVKDKEIDLYCPDELDILVDYVKDILSYKNVKRLKDVR
jgi:hypothetical protein